jgi:cytochrome b6-f complex iron-sulfur subunit
LTKEGDYVDSTKNILIANTSDNRFISVTLICTHEQKRKVYYSTNKFICSEHNATFDNKGNATSVASRALATYNITQV